MKKTHCIFITILAMGFSACSDDNNEPIKDYSLKLVADRSSIQPFEDIKLKIDVPLEDIYEAYDSVTWVANGLYLDGFGFFPISGDDEREIKITDYKVGKHQAYVLGYKEGIIISKDSIKYEVTKPIGDFLSVNWADVVGHKFLGYFTGFTPNKYAPTIPGFTKIEALRLDLWTDVIEGSKYVHMEFLPWTFESNFRSENKQKSQLPNINDFDWHGDPQERVDIEYRFMHTYLKEFYGEPSFVYEGDDPTLTPLWDEYNKRFDYIGDNCHPYEIWETPTSYICLCRGADYSGIYTKGLTRIIATPRK